MESDRDGLAVARAARAKAPDARVVLFSGHDLETAADEAAAAGVDEMLQKPIF